ncbi:MAG TPA: DUF3311 domain-containing protein [Verrucomicrobiae bacterium]|nr:DUF3311 domain-containing protein [Verrucomicrobiae bacterium]
MKRFLLLLIVVVVYLLHQDNWNWKNSDLVFGFLPVGLAYHAGYSILAAVMMAVLVKFAWPKHLEEVQPEKPDVNRRDAEPH